MLCSGKGLILVLYLCTLTSRSVAHRVDDWLSVGNLSTQDTKILLSGERNAVRSFRAEDDLPDVVVYIAGGKLANSKLFTSSVVTLGSNGGWRRPVVVFTDRSACVRANVLPRAKAHNVDLRVLEIPKPAKSENAILHHKSFKTKIWETLEDAGYRNMNRVMYLDEDIVVGRDMQSLLSGISSAPKSAGVLCFQQPTGGVWTAAEKYHTAILVLQNSSGVKTCLNDWGSLILSRRYDKDQTALIHSSCVKDDHIAIMPSPTLMHFPDDKSMAKKQSDLFNHFTNTYRMKKKEWHDSILQYFSSVMHLDTDDLYPWGQFTCEDDTNARSTKTSHGSEILTLQA